MKGLLLKDLFVVSEFVRVLTLMAIVFIASMMAIDGFSVIGAMISLLVVSLVISSFSYDDLAIQRGLRMVYHHRKIDRKLFEKYHRRFSPYCSVASLYLWEVSGGAIPGMRDYALVNK